MGGAAIFTDRASKILEEIVLGFTRETSVVLLSSPVFKCMRASVLIRSKPMRNDNIPPTKMVLISHLYKRQPISRIGYRNSVIACCMFYVTDIAWIHQSVSMNGKITMQSVSFSISPFCYSLKLPPEIISFLEMLWWIQARRSRKFGDDEVGLLLFSDSHTSSSI